MSFRTVIPEKRDSMLLLLSFADVVDSVRLEAARLKDEGVEMLIAVGHYGYAEDMAMAQQGWANLLVIGLLLWSELRESRGLDDCQSARDSASGNLYVWDQERALYINLLSRSNSVS